MTAVGADFMGRCNQKILIPKTIGEAFADVVRRMFGGRTNDVIHAFGIDRKTVNNLRDGKAGAAVLSKALIARKASHDDAWDMADAIIEQVLGESRDEYEARKVRTLIETAENAQSLARFKRARRAALAERASFVDEGLARIAARSRGRRDG